MTNPYSTPASDLQHNTTNGQNDTTSPFSAKGRFSRLSFLAWNFILNLVIMIIAGGIAVLTGAATSVFTGEDPNAVLAFYSSGAGLVLLAIFLISFVISIIFFIRRLHDIDMSGWLALLVMVPFVNLFFGIYVLVKKGTEGDNRFGPARATPKWERILGIIALVIIVLYIAVVIIGIISAIMAGGMTPPMSVPAG